MSMHGGLYEGRMRKKVEEGMNYEKKMKIEKKN